MTSTPPTPRSSWSARHAHRSPAGRAARAVRCQAPLDAFVDAPLARVRRRRAPPAIPAPVLLALLASAAIAVAVVARTTLPLLGVCAVAVAAGAWLSGRALVRFLPLLAGAGAAAAVVVAGGPTIEAIAPALVALFAVLGFGMLPRSLVFAAVHAARRAEQARADGEVLRLIDDARLFRRLAGARAADDDTVLKDVSEAVAQRDRLYRLLRLTERVIDDTAVVALYALDDTGGALRLVEQLARVDASNHVRLPLGGRGVGPAGIVGLCLQRRAPLRVVDSEGAAVRAHRQTGAPPRSVLCVPLLSRGSGVARAVLVLDRVEPVAFSDDDEGFAMALGEEILDGLATEQVVDELDAERRRVARVYAAARALAGVSRSADVAEQAVRALQGLCAGVAVVDVRDDAAGAQPPQARVLAAAGPLAPLKHGFLDDSSFAGRALAERVPLPHTSLDKASPRPLLFADDAVPCSALGDVRAVPLLAHGEARGVLLVATAPGEKLRAGVVQAVCAIADVVAVSLASAAAFDDVERQATTDGLTGVWNRRTLDRRLDEGIARARRSGQPLCVLLTDVDHFKSVNDAWGHATGDEVLKGVARTLQACARATDLVGRLGGEEFVVVCEATDLPGAMVLAERMRTAIKSLSFETPKGPLSVTSSFGVALLSPDESGHDVLERADQQLYKAKQQGRDRVVGG